MVLFGLRLAFRFSCRARGFFFTHYAFNYFINWRVSSTRAVGNAEPYATLRELFLLRSIRMPNSTAGEKFQLLVDLMARLRAPNGCPWDREQTFDTIKPYLLEETYEVMNSIDARNWPELAGELGDLLLQPVFFSHMAAEQNLFRIDDALDAINEKLVRRHPHVFGKVKADTPEQVLKNWVQLKAKEKNDAAPAKQLLPSALEGIPRSLPALIEAHQLTRRAAQVGFDWETVEGIFTKLLEETSELRVALSQPDRSRREEEVGDLLFVAVNLARFLRFDPEVALKHSNLKFKLRFQNMEADAARSGQRLAQLSKDELEVLWDAAKKRERSAAHQETE